MFNEATRTVRNNISLDILVCLHRAIFSTTNHIKEQKQALWEKKKVETMLSRISSAKKKTNFPLGDEIKCEVANL